MISEPFLLGGPVRRGECGQLSAALTLRGREVCPSLGRRVSGQEGRPEHSVLPGPISEELTAAPRPQLCLADP